MPVIILNKYDQGIEAELIEIKKIYKDYDLLFTSTKTGEGIEGKQGLKVWPKIPAWRRKPKKKLNKADF